MIERSSVYLVALSALGFGAAACTGQTRPVSPAPRGTDTTEGNPADTTSHALAALKTRPEWLFPATACPADASPPLEVRPKYLGDGCTPNLEQCLSQCEGHDAAACYGAAIRVQELNVDEDASEALYLQACRLGVRSGCTNRAAGMMKRDPEGETTLRCATRSFELTCSAGDAWGCSMLGLNLAFAYGTPQDLPRALEALSKACSEGEDAPACVASQSLIRKVRERLAEDAGSGTAPHE